MRTNHVVLAIAAVMVLMIPVTLASPAHPHFHAYTGSSTNNVLLKVDGEVPGNGSPLARFSGKATLDATASGLCADVLPLVRVSPLPPQPYSDGDDDVSVGGSCFAFQTVNGDDTGGTYHVKVLEQYGRAPVWITCVDVNGDGICSQSGADQYNLCWTGGANFDGVSLLTPGPCLIYADPAAWTATIPNPAIYVWFIGSAVAEDGTVEYNQAIRGAIYLQ